MGFKIGDKVRIISNSNWLEDRHNGPGYTLAMSMLQGSVFEVDTVGPTGNLYIGRYWWVPSWVEPIKSVMKQKLTLKDLLGKEDV